MPPTKLPTVSHEFFYDVSTQILSSDHSPHFVFFDPRLKLPPYQLQKQDFVSKPPLPPPVQLAAQPQLCKEPEAPFFAAEESSLADQTNKMEASAKIPPTSAANMTKTPLDQVDKHFASLKSIKIGATISDDNFKFLSDAALGYVEDHPDACSRTPRLFKLLNWKNTTNDFIESTDLVARLFSSDRHGFNPAKDRSWPDDKTDITFLMFALLKLHSVKHLAPKKRKSGADDGDESLPSSSPNKKIFAAKSAAPCASENNGEDVVESVEKPPNQPVAKIAPKEDKHSKRVSFVESAERVPAESDDEITEGNIDGCVVTAGGKNASEDQNGYNQSPVSPESSIADLDITAADSAANAAANAGANVTANAVTANIAAAIFADAIIVAARKIASSGHDTTSLNGIRVVEPLSNELQQNSNVYRTEDEIIALQNQFAHTFTKRLQAAEISTSTPVTTGSENLAAAESQNQITKQVPFKVFVSGKEVGSFNLKMAGKKPFSSFLGTVLLNTSDIKTREDIAAAPFCRISMSCSRDTWEIHQHVGGHEKEWAECMKQIAKSGVGEQLYVDFSKTSA